jgi:homoserine dehydrogenase
MGKIKIALLGVGAIGRELIYQSLQSPLFSYVALGDKSGVLVNEKTFSRKELLKTISFKENGGQIREIGKYEYHESMLNILGCCSIDVLVDVTNTHTYKLLFEALDHANVVISNKIPIADVSYKEYMRLVTKARKKRKILDFGTTAGAGMRIPNIIKILGSEIDYFTGCLSGTMNYVSQRINENISLSKAIKEAMNPPRNYTEPDPRIDLAGKDVARKMVIIGRICGIDIELERINIEDIFSEKFVTLSLDEFMRLLPSIDHEIKTRIESANRKNKTLWYLCTADLRKNEYKVGFEEINIGDPITKTRESDNSLRLLPSKWKRPVTITGPGAGPLETVTGLISGLNSVLD